MKGKVLSKNYEKKLNKIDKKPRKLINYKWVFTITFIAYLLSLFFSLVTEVTVPNMSALIGIGVILLIVLIGVFFDMVGVAVTAANLSPFNSMASKNVKGSKTAIYLIKNAEKVSAICNDVVGDVCGIISGSVGILISGIIASSYNFNQSIVTLLLTSLIAALTIGGKSVGKSFAINKSDIIIFKVSKFISLFKKEGKRK